MNSSLRRKVLAGVRLAAVVASSYAVAAHADPISILFVGNSFTFGEPAGGPPVVEHYRVGSVTDLNNEGIGGVPALFKQMTVEAGLNYAVSLETHPGVGLDWHYQNALAKIDKPWDQVVLQSYSTLDGSHPGNPALLIQYTGIFSNFLHAQNPNVDIHLDATWSRADQTYLPTGHWYGDSIWQMQRDVRAGYNAAKAATPGVDDVIQVGQGFARTWETGFADTNPYDGITPGEVNMWAPDSYHASIFGYFLEALMEFGDITGVDPLLLGFDQVAMDLGITAAQAFALETIASQTLAGIPEPETIALLLIGVVGAGLASRRRRSA